jgi:hypothetical protein
MDNKLSPLHLFLNSCWKFEHVIYYFTNIMLYNMLLNFMSIYQYGACAKSKYNHLVSIYSNILTTKGNLYGTDLTHISNSGPSGVCFVLYANNRYLDLSQILEMRHIYCQLHDVLWLVNKCYGIPVFLLITATIITFIPTFFMVITFIQNVILGESEFANYMIFSSHLCWCISILFTFVWIVSCCHLVTEEVHKLFLCIHKIQIYSNVTESTIVELRSFVSQLKDMKFEFSVCGHFELNLSFLCGSLGVVTTYVTVLFQLK